MTLLFVFYQSRRWPSYVYVNTHNQQKIFWVNEISKSLVDDSHNLKYKGEALFVVKSLFNG